MPVMREVVLGDGHDGWVFALEQFRKLFNSLAAFAAEGLLYVGGGPSALHGEHPPAAMVVNFNREHFVFHVATLHPIRSPAMQKCNACKFPDVLILSINPTDTLKTRLQFCIA